MTQISEGKARIYASGDVFYNPKMETLRDISVSFLNAVGCGGRSLLDATSATGIRAIRYAKECGMKKGVALDMNRKAYGICKRNLKANKVRFAAVNKSVQEFANTYDGKFDIIDLDPFGSPAPCIYDVMKVSKGGTILMVTATDTAVLCGAHSKACVKIYNAKPLHNELCKEAGIRILIGYAARMASQFNFGVAPMLSVSDMHYMRIFFSLEGGASEAEDSLAKVGIGAYCRMCGSTRFGEGMAPLIGNACGECGSKLEGFGPLWTGMLYDKEMTSKMLKNKDIGIIRRIDGELDVPMFYSIPDVTSRLGRSSVSHYKVIELLKKRGRLATTTQFSVNGIKTDATAAEVVDIVRGA
ncbi:MAG: hypothetical protein ACYCO0_02915 [Candidatus Micrarchaeaceae archaeon]